MSISRRSLRKRNRGERMNEYAIAQHYEGVIGKRARVKDRLEGYCSFLWKKKGTIGVVHGRLFLKFDTPAKRYEDDNMPMDGVYLTEGSFKVMK
jgi:hypothetical protein